jgi:uncharacterized protein (DUF952 family)
MIIYKICTADDWRAAIASGVYGGSAHDQRDGFIHFSTYAQLAGTLAKHYAGQDDLLLAGVDAEKLGTALKWEPARNAELFPHLYTPLALSAVLWVRPVPLGESGTHIIPREDLT